MAEVRWYKNGAPILPHAHSHIMLQGRDTLVLAGVGERDAGVYQCVAANSVGEAQAAAHITIKGKPEYLVVTLPFISLCPVPVAPFPSSCIPSFLPLP